MYKQYGIRRFLKDYDFKLIALILILCTLGIFSIGSAKASVQDKQILGVVLGMIIMIIVSVIDYHLILKLYIPIYLVNIGLLVLVLSMGDDAGGAQRWLDIMGLRFQPSELAKILLILFFAQFIMINKEKINSLKIILSSVLLIVGPIILVYKQPDLSTTIMILILYCTIMYIGGISHKFVFGILAVIIPLAIIFLTLVLQPDQNLIKDYQQKRVLAWLHPDDYADTEAYQQTNSKMAIGSGQLFGKGYNTNEISSVKNGNFISEPQTDFIFAVIGEEWGFIGGCIIICLEIIIALRCALIGWRAKDLAGHIIASGMAGLIGFQSFINIGVATGLLPNTGIPLPFVSAGLTSVVSLFLGIGFVLNVRLQSRRA